MIFTRSLIRVTRSQVKCPLSQKYSMINWKQYNHSKRIKNNINNHKNNKSKLNTQRNTPKIVKSKPIQLIHKRKVNKPVIKQFKKTFMLPTLFKDGLLKKYIVEKTIDPWSKTLFQGYVFMDPKQKGEFGENLVSRYMTHLGFTVESRTNSGHDRLINGIPTEIKFSLTQKNKTGGVHDHCFMINHISLHKRWERLIFMGIDHKQTIHFIWFSKLQFKQYLSNTKERNCVFQRQQGGASLKNDDYLCGGKNFAKLLTLPFVNSDIRKFR